MNHKEQTDHKAINLMLPAILQAITTDFPRESIIKHQTKLKHYLTFQFDRSEYVGAQAYQIRLYTEFHCQRNLFFLAHLLNM